MRDNPARDALKLAVLRRLNTRLPRTAADVWHDLPGLEGSQGTVRDVLAGLVREGKAVAHRGMGRKVAYTRAKEGEES